MQADGRRLRAAALRGALTGLPLLALGGLLAQGGGGRRLPLVAFCALVGLLAAVPAWLEERGAAAQVRSPGRDALRAALAGLVAFVGVVAALAQVFYLEAVSRGDEDPYAFATQKLLRLLRGSADEVLPTLAAMALPFASVTWVRLRGSALRWQLVQSAPAVVLGLALVLSVMSAGMERTVFGALVVVTGLGLPLLAALADRLERRLWPPDPG